MAMSMPQPLHAVETFEMLASGSFALLPGFRTFVRCVCVCLSPVVSVSSVSFFDEAPKHPSYITYILEQSLYRYFTGHELAVTPEDLLCKKQEHGPLSLSVLSQLPES